MKERLGREIYDEMVKWASIFIEDGNKLYDKGNKTAGKRARKAIKRIKELETDWLREQFNTGKIDLLED